MNEKKKGVNPKSLENIKGHGWKPGESGNPAGRPRGFSQVVQGMAWDRMNQLIDITWNKSVLDSSEGLKTDKDIEKTLSSGQLAILMALKDPEQASKTMLQLLDRVLGKPKQEIDWTDKTKKEAKEMSNEDLLKQLKARGLEIRRAKE